MSAVRSRRVGRLPAEWTSFIGRRRELADLRRLFAAHRLVTLTGVAGVGKSRLARHAAEQLVRGAPGGIWWVGLERLADPADLPATVLAALDRPQPDPQDPVAGLVSFLAERPAVLVLDDAEHLVDACAGLAGTLLREVATLRILVTSREVLRVPGEHVLTVEPLKVPGPAYHGGTAATAYPAVTLFCQRAAATVPGFTLTAANAEAVGGICRRLDGLPLAIELAATRLRALSPDQILSRLDDQLDLLVTSARTASSRQRSLRGAFDWSYELCSPAERTAWAQLSVFTGGFDLPAAEHVCTPGAEPLDPVLDRLVGKSVLLRTECDGQVRFRMLATVARYGREKLDGAPAEDVLRRRHADWYARLTRRAEQSWFGPDELRWLTRLRTEHGNLRTALDYQLASPDGRERALRMVADLWFYWSNAAPADEAQHWLDRVLAADPRPGPARAKALWAAGYVATIRSDVDAALRFLSEAEVLATALADVSALAWTASRAAVLAVTMEDFPQTEALAEEALRRFEAARETGAGPVLTRLALATGRLLSGDVEGARQIAEQCRSACARHGELAAQGTALLILARVCWATGDHGAATGYLHRALRLRPALPAPIVLTLGLDVLGWLAGAAGEHERVAVLYGGLAQLRRTHGANLMMHTPTYAAPHAEAEAAALAALGESGYAVAYARGAAMGTEELVRYAMGEKPRRGTGTAEGEPALTARERQIAALVAGGLSNRQIATKLVISQRTAETHIEHVLRKLNFTSRAQIAAWAAQLPGAGPTS